ncbi:MAG: hypothetical protein KQI62_08485 [Deltaproteobacteria bacterium]|nr:hypothetical protein [Deltaproteobacteria bacterium]
MSTPVRLIVQGLELTGHLDDSQAGRTLAESLPLAWSAERWGHEYYGPLDLSMGHIQGQGKQDMEVGELAFHAQTCLLCLFFGPTPMSQGEVPRAAFPVLSVGMLDGDWEGLAALGGTVRCRLEAM